VQGDAHRVHWRTETDNHQTDVTFHVTGDRLTKNSLQFRAKDDTILSTIQGPFDEAVQHVSFAAGQLIGAKAVLLREAFMDAAETHVPL